MTHDAWDEEERALLEGLHDALDEVRLRHAGDPPLDVLAAAQGDVLPPGWQEGVQAHLDRSAWSRALLAAGDLPAAPLSAADEDRLLASVTRAARGAGRGRWPGALLLGGALAASVLLAVALWPGADVEPIPPATVAESTDAGRATSPDVPPLAPLAFEAPALQAPLAALTWRGEQGDTGVAYAEALAPAFDAYRAGDYLAADLAFRDAAERFPEAFDVLYYGGIARLALGRHEAAVDALERAVTSASPDRTAEVTWYLAVALQRADRGDAALAHLRTLCAGDSDYRGRACAALEPLDAGGANPH